MAWYHNGERFSDTVLCQQYLGVKGVYWKGKKIFLFFSNTEKHFSVRLPVDMHCLRVACTYLNSLSTPSVTVVVSFVCVCVCYTALVTRQQLLHDFDPSTWVCLCCAVHLWHPITIKNLSNNTLYLLMGIFTVLTLQYHLSPHQHHLEVENKSHNSRTCTQTAFRRNLISHLVPECAENRVITVESFLM